MSGKKSYEVTDLLSRGAQIRDEIQQKEFSNISQFEKRIEDANQDIRETSSDINNYKLDFNLDTQNEFPEEVKQYQDRYEKIVMEAHDLRQTEDGKVFVRKAKEAREGMQKADSKADELRRKVTNNPHYCDREYEEAQQLVRLYDQGKNDIRSARASMEQLANKVTQVHTKMNSLQSELVKITEAVTSINHRAKEIVHIRSQANLLRQQSREEFQRIYHDRANKFAPSEYTYLLDKLGQFEASNDNEVTRSYAAIFKLISEVNGTIEQRFEEFETKRKNATLHMNAINEKLQLFHVSDPEQRIQNKTVKIGLFDYEAKFGQEQSRSAFEELWKKAIGYLDTEQFDSSQQMLQQMDALLNESMDRCQQLNEYHLKQTYMTQDVVQALEKLGYPQIDVEYIDNDFRNGFTVKATVGDEILHFERLSVSEEGPIVEINHKESVTGTCGPSMQKVMIAMQEQGIFVTDVCKNGRSVVYHERKPTPTPSVQNNKKRGNLS